VVIARGDVYWVDLGAARGSRPAKRRPVVVLQSAPYNRSRLATVIVAVVTSNTALARMPGNVFLPAAACGLQRDSVVNVTALATVDKADLDGPAGRIPAFLMHQVDSGLRHVVGI
jgi:mRNA interferase MazF